MKKILFGLSLFAAFSLSSCIQNEPANSECDIEEAYVVASDEEALFFTPNDAVKDVASSDTSIVFYLREDFTDSTQLQALKINFKLTPGASITPENGRPSMAPGLSCKVRTHTAHRDRPFFREHQDGSQRTLL